MAVITKLPPWPGKQVPVALTSLSFPLPFVDLVVLFSILVGFITGAYLALRAARLNPLLALRYE